MWLEFPNLPYPEHLCSPMTLPEGRSRYDFGLNTLEPVGTLMQCVWEDTLD